MSEVKFHIKSKEHFEKLVVLKKNFSSAKETIMLKRLQKWAFILNTILEFSYFFQN